MHITRVIQKLQIENGWKRRKITAVKVAHSPDLSPSNFHLFLHLKKHLAGQKFHEDEEVKNKARDSLQRQQSSTTSEHKNSNPD